jgi:hypothetical protein
MELGISGIPATGAFFEGITSAIRSPFKNEGAMAGYRI